jgi:hypothetical protein
LLRATRSHLQTILKNRQQYETTRRQAVQLGESLATLLPLVTDQLNAQLGDQDQALDDLGLSIDEIGDMLPGYAHLLGRLLDLGRLLCWLVAATLGLHGFYLIA